MHPIDIKQCLDSMQIIVDTREQPSERAKKRFASFGVPYSRGKLNYCDYTYNFMLPDGKWLFDCSEQINPHCGIERKMNLEELSGCLCQQRERFKREFERAKEHDASVYLLVENATWENLINGRYKTRFNKEAYFASVTAWIARYNIKPILCKSEMSGILIKQILYRELKERLESGFYG